LSNIYGNGSRHVTQRVKPTKTLNRESLFILSRLSSCRSTNSPESESAWESGEGEDVAEQQSPRALGYEATTSSWRRRLGVVEASLPEKHQAPYLARQMLKWFYDTSIGAAIGAARYGSFVGVGFGLLVISYG
jgi:hypothetical protein